NRLETTLGIKIAAATLIQGPSVDELVEHVLPELAGLYDNAPAQPAPITAHSSKPELPQLPMLTETQDSVGRWLVIVVPRAAPRLRLFCFPFAGGGSAVYRNWAQFIDSTTEVIAIEPPGRLGRITEPPI